MFCQKCGKEIMDEAVICPHCGCATGGKVKATATDDAPNTGYAVLGFFIPIIGLIMYLSMKNEKPLAAKSAGKGALIGFAVGAIGYVFLGVLFALLL